MDLKFWISEVAIPLVTFILGLFTGKQWNKYTKASSKIKGDGNSVTQNSKVEK